MERRDVLGWLLVAAVGLAFADASVVVLALPSMYGEFGTSIVGVSWVLTAYALVVAIAGLLLAVVASRLRPGVVTGAGLALFGAASIGCGVAPTQTVLIVTRCLQGLGAALLLAGALPVLAALRGPHAGRFIWGLSATIGLAVGPALGGLLTQLFDWRVIFFVQVPVAVAALAVLTDQRVRRAAVPPSGRRPAVLPYTALLFLSAALVGVLFLGVLLIIEVWQFSPLSGAVVVTLLPAGMLLVRPLARRLTSDAPSSEGRPRAVAGPSLGLERSRGGLAAGGGALLLAGGLVVLALVPGRQVVWAAVALAICGAGLGLLSAVLDGAAVGPDGGVRDGSLAVGARHAGLVLGLVLIAPVLAGSLEQATERSMLAGTASVLDARVSVKEKVRIALAVRDDLAANPRGQLPDLEATVRRADVDPSSAAQVGQDLAHRVTAVLTRAFRPAFTTAALLALATLLPALALTLRRRPHPPHPDHPSRLIPADGRAAPPHPDHSSRLITADHPAPPLHPDHRSRLISADDPAPPHPGDQTGPMIGYTYAGDPTAPRAGDQTGPMIGNPYASDPTAPRTGVQTGPMIGEVDGGGVGRGGGVRGERGGVGGVRRGSVTAAVGVLAVLVVGMAVVVGGEVVAGAASYGRYAELDGCMAGPDPYPGKGVDAAVQRLALSTVNGAACELKVSRERMLLSLDVKHPFGGRVMTRDELERGVRAGLQRAADDAEKRDDLPGWAADLVRKAAEHAPVDWLADRLGFPK